ncbi:hypothetical protein BSZ37_15485 [Rubrivirga marina]|uniref:RNA polymerase sigma-70 ECF-like HTH domain-containing protein n=1 Tax=Rubrivirga marina TaxID=1196024 RepID=A0A271J382_9BACT|nr:hypothetical protein BSZ37_15485 [Rubrivirga marina]
MLTLSSHPSVPVRTHDTTALISAARGGDDRASDFLFRHVYDELRRLSQARISAEPGVVTVSATGLVHEAYLKLLDSDEWADRSHFLAVASRAMRQILCDRARARNAAKRGGADRPITLVPDLDGVVGDEETAADQVLALDGALHRLAERDAGLAQLVELRFFGGLEMTEVAEVMGVSRRTVTRHWARARAYLRADLC